MLLRQQRLIIAPKLKLASIQLVNADPKLAQPCLLHSTWMGPSSCTRICARTRGLTHTSNQLHPWTSKLAHCCSAGFVQSCRIPRELLSVTLFRAMGRAGEQSKTMTDAGKDCPEMAGAQEQWWKGEVPTAFQCQSKKQPWEHHFSMDPLGGSTFLLKWCSWPTTSSVPTWVYIRACSWLIMKVWIIRAVLASVLVKDVEHQPRFGQKVTQVFKSFQLAVTKGWLRVCCHSIFTFTVLQAAIKARWRSEFLLIWDTNKVQNDVDRKKITHLLWDYCNFKEKGLINNQLFTDFRKTILSYSWPLQMYLRHQIYFCCLFCINQQKKRPKLNSWTCSRTQIPGWRLIFQCVQHPHLCRYRRPVLSVKGQPLQKKKVPTRH